MIARTSMRRRLQALEVDSDEAPPPYVVVGFRDVSVPEPGEPEPEQPDPASLVTVVRVSGVAEPISRRAGETDEALYLRAARAWPLFGIGDGVPVLKVRDEPIAQLARV